MVVPIYVLPDLGEKILLTKDSASIGSRKAEVRRAAYRLRKMLAEIDDESVRNKKQRKATLKSK